MSVVSDRQCELLFYLLTTITVKYILITFLIMTVIICYQAKHHPSDNYTSPRVQELMKKPHVHEDYPTRMRNGSLGLINPKKSTYEERRRSLGLVYPERSQIQQPVYDQAVTIREYGKPTRTLYITVE